MHANYSSDRSYQNQRPTISRHWTPKRQPLHPLHSGSHSHKTTEDSSPTAINVCSSWKTAEATNHTLRAKLTMSLYGTSSTDLTNHYRNPHLRQLPHYRTCIPNVARSCNPFISPPSLCLRRIGFLIIVLLRIVQVAYYTLAWRFDSSKILIPVILICVIMFSLEIWNLHLITEAEGERRLFGFCVPSWAYRVFFWVWTLWHFLWIPLEASGIAFWMDAKWTLWMEVWSLVLLCSVAWVTGRGESEMGAVNLA